MSGRRALRSLVRKEVLDLLRDRKILVGMILMPTILYPVIGLATRASMSAAEKTALTTPVAVLDLDRSEESDVMVAALRATGTVLEVSSQEAAVREALSAGAGALIEIPEGFGEALRSGKRVPVRVTVFFERGGFSSVMFTGRLSGALDAASQALASTLVVELGVPDPQAVLDPLQVSYSSVFRGQVLDVPPDAVAGAIAGQATMLPMVASLVLIFAMQIAATSIAVEKEEKTLETLLTLPVSRRSILLAKLSGSAVVATLGSVGVIAGLVYYMKMVTPAGAEGPAAELGLLGPREVVALGVALVTANMLALTLATVLAAFTEDVRSAQALVSNLFILVFLPAFLLMFADIQSLPRAAALALQAIPFSHLALASQALVWRDWTSYAISVLYLCAWTLGVAAVADRVFSSEKILTAKIRWGRRRRTKGQG